MNKMSKLIIVIVVSFAAYFLSALAATIIWHWFMVQEFGLPAISMTQAMGIGVVIAIFTAGFARRHDINRLAELEDETKEDRMLRIVVETISIPIFLLIIGGIIRSFM